MLARSNARLRRSLDGDDLVTQCRRVERKGPDVRAEVDDEPRMRQQRFQQPIVRRDDVRSASDRRRDVVRLVGCDADREVTSVRQDNRVPASAHAFAGILEDDFE
jgi:hypothetical protein